MTERCKCCGHDLLPEIKVPGYTWDYENSKWVKIIEPPKEVKEAEEEC